MINNNKNINKTKNSRLTQYYNLGERQKQCHEQTPEIKYKSHAVHE